ncbi:flavodoxin family protein [Streptomyces ipomoeae]|uniref:flavodoxin family protein n=1 Tax=Streptomyces ipomoeae TaxID=103232 RepID=UPI0029AFCB4F|nr:flavodoxin family protein [Streptomyces ipomoeae]MDX2828252.1 flavodoxin family protein [Streptomyces ipomoeae]MDX2874219.1 flavodoxin family protein [Streptomyces ipomoeae]
MTSPIVSIAYHSGYGHTAVLAEAVQRGAKEAGAVVNLIAVGEITDLQWEQLDASDAIIFGSPTYMGTASTVFHGFAEATSKRWMGQAWKDKLAAGFTNSASNAGDKQSTLQYFATLASQHGMHWIALGMHGGWNSSKGSENDLNRLGFFLGAAAQANADQGAEAVTASDIATAEALGRRVADAAATWVAGRTARAA